MRFFIPQIPSYIKPDLLEFILPYSEWIGFNYFDLIQNSIFLEVQRHGIKEIFNISDNKKIFITTTAKDEKLIQYYNKQRGLNEFISTIENLDFDLVMGPDWFVYEDMSKFERTKNIVKASIMNQKCLKCEKIIPNIHGTNMKEMREFIKPFKEQGKELFAFPGREYLINIGDRKQSMLKILGFTRALTRQDNIELVVSGANSPKLHNYLSDVKVFVGLGWFIQAYYRRLIDNDTYNSIFGDFEIDNKIEDRIENVKELAESENDSVRVLYNLRKINDQLVETFPFKQRILGEYCGAL